MNVVLHHDRLTYFRRKIYQSLIFVKRMVNWMLPNIGHLRVKRRVKQKGVANYVEQVMRQKGKGFVKYMENYNPVKCMKRGDVKRVHVKEQRRIIRKKTAHW